MNSAVVKDPDLVSRAKEKFGMEKVTVAVDARRNSDMPSGFELVVSGGTKPVGKDAVIWAAKCRELGAGAILPTSMDGDGTQKGYDLEFTRAVSDAVSLPVIASGGAGTLEHFYEGRGKGRCPYTACGLRVSLSITEYQTGKGVSQGEGA